MRRLIFLVLFNLLQFNLIHGQSSTTTRKPNYTPVNITFTVSGKDLPSKDQLTEADAFLTLYSTSEIQKEKKQFGKSEAVVDSNNPNFKEVFWFIWTKGTGQKWHIEVTDFDTLRNDKIGDVVVDVDEFVEKGVSTYKVSPQPGTLTLTRSVPVAFRLYARNVPKKDEFGGKSDPFVKVYYKTGEKGEQIKFGTTSVIDNEENPDWPERIEFPNYVKGTDQYWVIKIKDKDTLSDDDIAEVQVKVDPFVEKRQTQIVKLEGKGSLGITPA